MHNKNNKRPVLLDAPPSLLRMLYEIPEHSKPDFTESNLKNLPF